MKRHHHARINCRDNDSNGGVSQALCHSRISDGQRGPPSVVERIRAGPCGSGCCRRR